MRLLLLLIWRILCYLWIYLIRYPKRIRCKLSRCFSGTMQYALPYWDSRCSSSLYHLLTYYNRCTTVSNSSPPHAVSGSSTRCPSVLSYTLVKRILGAINDVSAAKIRVTRPVIGDNALTPSPFYCPWVGTNQFPVTPELRSEMCKLSHVTQAV